MTKNISIEENISLAPLTTLKIGGKARFFVRAETEEQVVEAFDFADRNSFKVFVLGGGSNILVSDEGFDGLVLQIAIRGISLSVEVAGKVNVLAGAGENWDALVEFCVAKNLQGFECLSGIPGFVGGTPVQNVGAYGQEVSETIVLVRCFDRKSREIIQLSNAECRFNYRTSIFNTTERERFIVLAVEYALNVGGKPKIAYGDLQKFFGEKTPTLKETREAVLTIRAAKSMVIDENDLDSRSAGSFFKNPIVSEEIYKKIAEKARALNLIETDKNVPFYKVDEQNVKIPAAWLIENSGFFKGYAKGEAALSTKHALAITNRGNASAAEVSALQEEIQIKVKQLFGVDLIPEPIFVGFNETARR